MLGLMSIAGWIRECLWPAESWSEELARLRRDVPLEPPGARRVVRLFDLAWASEYCDPDRGRALELYLAAWREGHAEAGAHAKRLAAQLFSHVKIAEIAVAEGDAYAAGAAFLDAGLSELAAEPLQRLLDQHKDRRAAVPEGTRVLLQLARHQAFDAEAEITAALARAAAATGPTAVAAYVHAARIARLGNRRDRLPAILSAASRASPGNEEILALVELRLVEANDADGLLAHFRDRFERAPTRGEYVDLVRRAALELIAYNLQPGLGLRLLRMSLEHAYAAELPSIGSHIAAWEHLIAHAAAQQSTVELVPLLVQAIGAPLPDDDAMYLARTGLAIVWKDGKDTLAAQPYAAVVLDFVRDHPLASALVATVTGQPAATAPRRSSAPALAASSVAPRTTGRLPAVAPAAPAERSTGRMPALVDGPVKRSEVAPSAAQAHRISGRLALLRPPPPRETPLVRDTSPIPEAPRPQTPTAPRAPRRIVPVDATVALPDGSTFSTLLRDISTTGAFVVTRKLLAIGTLIRLEMKIPTTSTMMQVKHRTNAQVMRCSDLGLGVAFIGASAELVALLEKLAR